MSTPTLVVLAAGIGSRYGGLKQMDPVGPYGELVIDYSVYDALRAGFRRVLFVVNDRIQQAFRERVGQVIERQCDTLYVCQSLGAVPSGCQVPFTRLKPWGTAHALLVCQELVDSHLAVINADDFYGRASYQALYDYLSQAQDNGVAHQHCMVGFPLMKTLTEHGAVARGICQVDEDGFLVDIHERTSVQPFGPVARYTEDGHTWFDLPHDSIASMNMWGFTTGIMAELASRFTTFFHENAAHLDRAEFFLSDVVGDMVGAGKARVRVLPTTGQWLGMTHPRDKSRVRLGIESLIAEGVYPSPLWAPSPLWEAPHASRITHHSQPALPRGGSGA